MNDPQAPIRTWSSLDPDEQTTLRIEYGYYLDSLPPTCSLQTKLERFRRWLRRRASSTERIASRT
jgi:hypothetical protein